MSPRIFTVIFIDNYQVLSHTQKQGHEFLFKINDSVWSKVTILLLLFFLLMRVLQPVSLEAPAAETELVVSSYRQKADIFHVGLSWTEGLGKYKLSKVITLTPRFLIVNRLSETITFREHGISPPEPSLIKPGEQSAVLVLRSKEEKLLTIAYPGLNSRWQVISPSVCVLLSFISQVTGH